MPFRIWLYVAHAHVMGMHRTVYRWKVYPIKSIWYMADVSVRIIQKD